MRWLEAPLVPLAGAAAFGIATSAWLAIPTWSLLCGGALALGLTSLALALGSTPPRQFGAGQKQDAIETRTSVQLEVMLPEGPPLRVGALVWRGGPNGPALLFSSGILHRLLRSH